MASFACSAILFDLDGVLVDSTPCVTRIWTAWAHERGLDPEYVVHVAHGQRTIETVRAVAPYLDAQAETDEIEQDVAHRAARLYRFDEAKYRQLKKKGFNFEL